MSDELSNVTSTEAPAPSNFRARFESYKRTQRRKSLGLAEVAALASAAVLAFAALFAYLFLLRPERARLHELTTERATLQTRIQNAHREFTERKDTQSSVREILASLENFEINHLGVAGGGSTSVIEELHGLLIRDNLRISGGMSYTQLTESAPGADVQRQARGGDPNALRVTQSVFPGVGITLTVEGTYPNLRRFIRDVEASRHFIVINGVELEGLNEAGQSSSAPGEEAAPRGSLVSLRLDMAAYFRRAGATAP